MVSGKGFSICTQEGNAPLLRLFHSVVPPLRRPYEEHRHTAFELSLIRGGSGVYRTGEQIYPFSAGDIFLFSSNEPHCIVEVIGESGLEILNLQFEPRFLWSAENLFFQVEYPDIFFHRTSSFSHRLSAVEGAWGEIRRRLLEVEREFLTRGTDYRLMVRLEVLSLLVTIRRGCASYFDGTAGGFRTACLAQMEGALDYIDRHLTEELNLERVARQAAMSPSYFSTLFKRLNGLTLWEYIQTRRVELAARQLATTDWNVSDIAFTCGYNSITNFNRRFKAITGQTPGVYRRCRARGMGGSAAVRGRAGKDG